MNPTRHEVQAEIVKAARRGQKVVIGAVKTSAGAVRSARTQVTVPNLPFASKLPKPDQLVGNAREFAGKLPKPEDLAGNARQFAERLPRPEQLVGNARELAGKLPRPEDLVGKLPKPDELAANARHFAERVLATQQKFAEDARRATAALLPTAGGADKVSPVDGDSAKSATATADTADTAEPAAEAAEASTPEAGNGESTTGGDAAEDDAGRNDG